MYLINGLPLLVLGQSYHIIYAPPVHSIHCLLLHVFAASCQLAQILSYSVMAWILCMMLPSCATVDGNEHSTYIVDGYILFM